jgi:hypothetical protein
LLRSRSLFVVHAGAAARGDDAVLVVGATGAGKTTTVLALALAGWSFLGDDLVFLRPTADRVFAFPDEADVTPRTFSLLPTLGTPADWPKLPGYPKRQIDVATLGAGSTVDVAAPRLLLVPSVASGSRQHLVEPIDPAAVMLDLVPNVLLTDGHLSQTHLDALAALANGVPAVRVRLGPELGALPGLVADLLVEVGGGP